PLLAAPRLPAVRPRHPDHRWPELSKLAGRSCVASQVTESMQELRDLVTVICQRQLDHVEGPVLEARKGQAGRQVADLPAVADGGQVSEDPVPPGAGKAVGKLLPREIAPHQFGGPGTEQPEAEIAIRGDFGKG